MNISNGKYAWMVKIGEKGQFVIPKEARDVFNIKPGDNLLILGDESSGIVVTKTDVINDVAVKILGNIEKEN